MTKIRWITLIGVVVVGLTALAWSIRPATAEALQLDREATTTATTLATTTGVTVEQDGTAAGNTSVAAIVKPGGAELLDAPNGTLLLSLNASVMLTATGRTTDGQWYQVTTGETEGWVAFADLIAINAETLPIVEAVIEAEIEAVAAAPEVDTPATNAPVTAAPAPGAPATDAPATDAPATDAPATDAPTTDTPTTDTPTTDTPATTHAAVPAIVRSGGATLAANAGDSHGTSLRGGTMLLVTGKSDDGAWLAVQTTETPVTTGWVAAARLIYSTVQSATAATGNTTSASGNALVSTIASTTAASNTPATDATAIKAPTTGAPTTDALATDALNANTLNTVTVASGTNNLNVRELPGTANAIVGKAAPGDALALLGKTADGSWLQVLLEDGVTGWISSNYVTGDTSAAPVMEESVTNAVATTTTVAPANTLAAVTTATTATSAPAASSAAASVDAAISATGLTGTLVYQTSPGGTFYAYDLETDAQWPLTSGWDPSISPDGQTVAFVRGGGETGIWLIDIDGSNERLIYGERRDLSSPKWSPDGAYLVFGRGDSYITCRQIGRECLPDSVWLDRNPNMDLDGFPLIDEYLQNLARIDVDGNNYRDLATLESAREPDWSSAGIVYASSDGLQITDDTEDAVNRVVYFEPLQARDQDPDWAGDRIVFITRQSSHYQIFSVNADGTGKTSLTKPVTTLVNQIPSNVAPAFSPDGSQIVFLSDRGENNEAGDWHLWVMNADGSDQRMLETIAAITYNFNNMEQAVSWGG